jgi:hypothetical protein
VFLSELKPQITAHDQHRHYDLPLQAPAAEAEAGWERGAADNVATKADIQASEASLRSELRTGDAALRAEVHEGFARQDVAMERLRSTMREMEGRMVVRLGGWLVVLFGLFFTALHAWPPH